MVQGHKYQTVLPVLLLIATPHQKVLPFSPGHRRKSNCQPIKAAQRVFICSNSRSDIEPLKRTKHPFQQNPVKTFKYSTDEKTRQKAVGY